MPPTSLDISFSVPFTHRLRFTQDILGNDFPTLLALLERDTSSPAKLLAIIEQGVENATQFSNRLTRRHSENRTTFTLADTLLIPGGESLKNNPASLEPILKSILDHAVDRRSYILTAGGGAFLDAVGMAAALAHRGIRLIRLPTTTMGQADSGVGVKNAINYFNRKNWLGSFAVPWAVINDAALLSTLPDRDFRAGFSEVVKVSLLKDASFFHQLSRDAEKIATRHPDAAHNAIEQSAIWHLRHITQGGDPFETREARPLDFGHWAAHRLEPLSNFQLRHGEAVAIGLAIDCTYSHLALNLPEHTLDQILTTLKNLGLPTTHELLNNPTLLLEGLEEFRQHLGGRLTITMLQDIARSIDIHEIDMAKMRTAIARIADRKHEGTK